MSTLGIAISEEVVVRLNELLRENLTKAVKSAAFTPDALERWPFLSEPGKFVDHVVEATRVQFDDKGVTVYVDRDVLKKHSLPDNVHQVLEFGDRVIPICSFLRPTIAQIGSL